ncbi:MAG: 2,3-bisphosphoglycerate-independent phosphoglycerate mutase [Pseudomonadota bacterium]|nr:2,3-bisphosphoglycerate-independent phosphoglycerate mutase [Pseudomonadota bacterium]
MQNTKLLLILDGWGYSSDTSNNAIALANTPNWDFFLENYPNTLIGTSGESVGLPDGQMGNSEVGHLTIGSGRIIEQDFTRIDNDIKSGEFFRNVVLCQALSAASQKNKAVHILGLLSDGGVHSHQDHIFAVLQLAKQRKCGKVYIHVFTDGRDTPPNSALNYVAELEAKILELGVGKIVSIVGRFYAMDRDYRWERTSKAYELIVEGKAEHSSNSAQEAIQKSYDLGENDEFIAPTTVGAPVKVNQDDLIIFMNYRADRARQITLALTSHKFDEFTRDYFSPCNFVCLTEYKKDFSLDCAYPPISVKNTLGDCISNLGFSQLRIAETEKYAHVTFFFNGGVEEVLPGEDRKLIQSPHVKTYDLKPEMSAYELTDSLIAEIRNQKYKLIICNFANTDMVGHTGNLQAAIKAVEAVDSCLGKIHLVAKETETEILITSDHGNAEQMLNSKTQKNHTAHTTNPVPLIYIGAKKNSLLGPHIGTLADLAPTLLSLMDIEQPKEMTGQNLLID